VGTECSKSSDEGIHDIYISLMWLSE